jgi:hypothetical protein
MLRRDDSSLMMKRWEVILIHILTISNSAHKPGIHCYSGCSYAEAIVKGLITHKVPNYSAIA